MKNFKKLLLSALCVLATVAINGCKNSGQEAPAAPAHTSQNNSGNPVAANPDKPATWTEQIGNRQYNVVKINGKIWMAENLRNENVSHYSANGDSSNDTKYGYLYTWENAQKACSGQWRLPTKDEFEQLIASIGDNNNSSSIRVADWDNGSDTSGFGARPAGYRFENGEFQDFASYAYFWSATPDKDTLAGRLFVHTKGAAIGYRSRNDAFSVRCLKDSN